MNRFAIAIMVTLSGAQPAFAAEERGGDPATDSAGWAVQITPYVWATGLEGDVSPFENLPAVEIEKPFSDVMDDFNVGGFVNVYARHGRLVLSGDAMYVSLTDTQTIGPLPPIDAPVPPGTIIDASLDTKQFTATLAAGYRAVDTPNFTLDTLGGARFSHISNKLALSAAGTTVSLSESFGWVDPVIAARAFFFPANKVSFLVQADIGGFGIGSDFTWSAFAAANYVFSRHFSASAGYKFLDVDYDHGGHIYDARQQGPVLGLTYRF